MVMMRMIYKITVVIQNLENFNKTNNLVNRNMSKLINQYKKRFNKKCNNMKIYFLH